MIKFPLLIVLTILTFQPTFAQQEVKFFPGKTEQKIDITVGGKFFTSYLYPDSIDKAVLYPITTASGITVSRGYPLATRPNERTDHPHHFGIWFNYGDVNGLDFWNNSSAIPAAKKSQYGSIRHQKIISIKGGKNKGTLAVSANWIDHTGKVLLKESTTFTISGDEHNRVVDRTSTLTAQTQVNFNDSKEGMFGIRVCRELEIPSDKPEIFTDANGIISKVPVLNNTGITGNFLTSEGKTGNDAWGTPGKWCMMYGKKNNDSVSVIIMDHPSNPGYPCYWHARGYGLFAANSLGRVAYGAKEPLNFALAPGQSATFRYRIIIRNGAIPSATELNKISERLLPEPKTPNR